MKMPALTRAQRQRNDAVGTARENEAARGRGHGRDAPRGRGAARGRGRGARGARGRGAPKGFVLASELPAGYQGGLPPDTTNRQRAAVRRRPAQRLLFPWDTEAPIFDMDQELIELRGLPNGHHFNEF